MTEGRPLRKTLRLRVRGRVQGVFFRDSMRRQAEVLQVAGWVRNCDDGSVEAVVHGGADEVDAIVRWAHQGPRGAMVSRVDIEPETGAWSGFEIRYD